MDDISATIKQLCSPSYADASDALAELVNLPPEALSDVVPLLLDHLGRFRNNSEWSWIVEALPPHYDRYRDGIDQAFREGLWDDYAFAPLTVLACLRRLGPTAAALVPDVLAYIGRQRAFTNQKPHLAWIDPAGVAAIPGLVELLGHPEEYVRYQAVGELEAYGARAEPALGALARLSSDGGHAAKAARQALAVIEARLAGVPTPPGG